MERNELVTAQMAAYLKRLGNQYSPRRHATIVAHLVNTFLVDQHEAEQAVREWLQARGVAVS